MAIERWELEQRRRGNDHAAEIARILRKQYGDVPLPQSVQNVSRERPTLDIVCFTPEARQKLEETGYKIHALTGQSIKTLQDLGKPFWSMWHRDYPELEAMGSRLSEVAVNLDQLFLPGSNRKTLREQEAMVKQFSKGLRVKGAEAIVGEMPDYVELAFAHLDSTEDRLFGKNYGYNYARTKTPTNESHVAYVGGGFPATRGLHVYDCSRDDGYAHLFAVPLVVPA